MVNVGRGDAPKGASPSLGRRHKLQFSVCIVSFVMFTISLEGNCGVIGRAVWLAVYRQPQIVERALSRHLGQGQATCRAHSFRAPRGHCPLESRRFVTLLATEQLLRRFHFGLRGSSSNVQQPARFRIHRQGRNTEYSAMEHTKRTQRSHSTKTRCNFPKVCSLQNSDGTTLNPMQRHQSTSLLN